MRYLITILLLSSFTLNAQEFHASKYGFSWYYNTAEMPAPGAITYGALWATWSGPQSIEATNTFSPFSEIRAQVIFQTLWNGVNSPITEQYLSAGKLVLLNVHDLPQTDTTHYSSTDLASWQTNVNKLTNSITQPANVLLAACNEEGNRNYSVINEPDDMENYIKMLSILARTGTARGFKVSNGGITTNALVFTTYRYLSDVGSADTTDFMNYCVPRNWWNGLRNRNSDAVEEVIANTQYLLNNYDTIPAIYLTNLAAHTYFPLAKRMTDTATNWNNTYTGIEQITAMLNYYVPGRELTISEMGFLINDPTLTSNVNSDMKANGIKHIIYWNYPGGNDGVLSIADNPTNKTALGENFHGEIVE